MRDVPFSSTDLAGQFPFDPGGRSSQGLEQRASKSKAPKPQDQDVKIRIIVLLFRSWHHPTARDIKAATRILK